MTLRAQVFQVIYDATRDRRTAREMGGVFEELDPYVDRVMALLAAPVRDAAESGSIDMLLAQLDQPDSTHVWSREDVEQARTDWAALRARVAGLERLKDDNDALRTEIERLNHHGDMLRGQLHVELTSHEATRVIARDARALLAVERERLAEVVSAMEGDEDHFDESKWRSRRYMTLARFLADARTQLRALAQPRAEQVSP